MTKIAQSILAGLGGMFGWGLSDYFASISSEKIGHFKTFFWSQVTGLIFSLTLVCVFGFSSSLSVKIAILLIIASIFYALGYLFFYKGFELGNVSIISATINLYAVFTMVLAYIFLGQKLTKVQLMGIFLVISGVFLVTVNFKNLFSGKVKFSLGVKEALLSSLLFGVFWNLSDVISGDIGWLPTTLLVKIGAIILLLIYSIAIRQKLRIIGLKKKVGIVVAAVGVFEAAAIASVNYGLDIGDTILVTPIASALSVVTILTAVVFLKEKLTKTQVIGVAMVVAGIIITGV